MPRKPQPAEASADTHREEEDEDSNEEVAAIPPGAEERDGGGGGGDGDQPPASGAGGSLKRLVTNKKVLMLLAAAAIAFVAYRYYQANGSPVDISTEERPTRDETGDEPDGGPQPQPQRPNIEKDPTDPLKADAEAFSWVFGDEEEADSSPPGE